MALTNTLVPEPPLPDWVEAFCKDYTLFLFDWGRGILIVGIALGAALAVAAVLVELRKKPAPDGPVKKTLAAPAPTVILDGLKAFIQALSSLPTWLALFGGGVLLLWMAANSIPEICKPSKQECPTGSTCTKTNTAGQPQDNSSGNVATTNSTGT